MVLIPSFVFKPFENFLSVPQLALIVCQKIIESSSSARIRCRNNSITYCCNGNWTAISNKLLAAHTTEALTANANNVKKTVIFSDSREGAAEVAAGVENEHFNNLIRQLLIQALDINQKQPVQKTLLSAVKKNNNLINDEQEALKWLNENYGEEHLGALRAHAAGLPLTTIQDQCKNEILPD